MTPPTCSSWSSGSIAAACALYGVLTRYLLRSIVALGAFLTAVAGEFYLLAADFVAVIQIFVYVGGIVVLMLFALMLSTSGERQPLAGSDRRGLGSLLAYALGGMLVWARWVAKFPAVPGRLPPACPTWGARCWASSCSPSSSWGSSCWRPWWRPWPWCGASGCDGARQ